MARSAEVEEFSKNFDEDFCLIACMESTTGSSIWYINNGASSHITGHKRFFRDLQEGGRGIHVELGDDARYQEKGVGTVSFQRESGKPFSLLMCYMFRDWPRTSYQSPLWRTRDFSWNSETIERISGPRDQIGAWIGWLGWGVGKCIDYTLSLERL